MCSRNTRLRFSWSILVLVSAQLLPQNIRAQDDQDFYYCRVFDGRTTYLSAPFLGLNEGRHDFERAKWADMFVQDLKKSYNLWDSSPLHDCHLDLFHGDRFRSHYIDARTRASRDSVPVVDSLWTPYENERLAERPIRDFHISVPASDRAVRVCVRDHECEDGDRVRVSVNGRAVFGDVEIVNEWSCRSVSVHQGRNSIELYAINGTGRKGNCSYSDGNTGEIRVESRNAETQTWMHRGGKGSNANIVITVR